MTKSLLQLLLQIAQEVEKEAQRRINNMTPEEKDKIRAEKITEPDDDWYHERDIMELLKMINRPIGTNTISELTGLPTSMILHRMKALVSYKKVRKMTARKVAYWRLV
ncbi:MAG: hypothetical protein ABIJ92_03060 [Candidatus Aenigmatarchaeota archaeon]